MITFLIIFLIIGGIILIIFLCYWDIQNFSEDIKQKISAMIDSFKNENMDKVFQYIIK